VPKTSDIRDQDRPKLAPSRRLLLATVAGVLAVGGGVSLIAAAHETAPFTEKEPLMNSNALAFTPANSAILLVDHQPGVLGMVGSLPPAVVTSNAALLARLGEQLDIPLVITSTRENIDFLGTTVDEIQRAAPAAYASRIRRGGSLDAFADPAFVAAVKSTDRRNLIIAGILTDVCLSHSVISALAAGYNVQVVADACGTSTTLADTVTYERLRALGATITSAYGILFDLYPDLSTPEGKKAESVAAAFIPKAN
jgi:nicotinamidase-related amidase